MPNPFDRWRPAAAAVAALVLASIAGGEDARTARGVTIRGTGNNIVIERARAEPQGPPAPPEEIAVYGPIAQAVRMKQAGATDEQVLGFLRAHVDELPSVIDMADVQRLRAAGLGREAIQRLTGIAGVDIGWSWPGRSAPEPAEPLLVPAEELSPGEAFYGPTAFGSSARVAFHRRPAFLRRPIGRPAPIPIRILESRPRTGGLRRPAD